MTPNFILVQTQQPFKPLLNQLSPFLLQVHLKLQTSIKNLGVYLDSRVSFDRQISEICKVLYFHIRALRHIRSSLTTEAAKTIASEIVGSRLDYCNSPLLAHLFLTWPTSSLFRIPLHGLWPKSLASIISRLFCLSCTGSPFVTGKT